MAHNIYIPNIVKPMKDKIISVLVKQGKKICHVAAAQRNTKPDTWNQQDAYGWGVYYDGMLERIGFARISKAATQRIKVGSLYYSGREEIKNFLKSFHPDVTGFCLVIANAMIYSSWHEEGFTPKGRMYRIVTQTYGMLSTAAGQIIDELKLDRKGVKSIDIMQWTRRP